MESSATTPPTFVLVPGGWHGAWTFDALAARLVDRGRRVCAVTCAGLEPEPTDGSWPNLDTHVEQVVDVVVGEQAPVVLCGHSYGGMVIAGVADRVPERIAHLVHLDAYVPADGDTCWTLTSDRFRSAFVAGVAADGRTVAVPRGLDPRARPHPLATMMQALRLTDPPAARDVARTFVYGGEWRGSPFVDLAARLRADPAWTVVDLPVGHDLMNRDPEGLADVLDALAGHR